MLPSNRSTMSNNRFYLNTGRRVLGPFDRQKLISLQTRGQLKPDYLISIDRVRWKTLAEFFPDPDTGTSSSSATEAAREWCVSAGESEFHRCDESDLIRQLESGQIDAGVLVWTQGLSGWKPARDAFAGRVSFPPPLPRAQPASPQALPAVSPAVQEPLRVERVADRKDKTVAALLALFLGGLGIHRFYLGNAAIGLLYLFFCWTLIPALIAFVEALVFLSMSHEQFDAAFNTRAIA